MNSIKTQEKNGYTLIGLARAQKLNALNEEMVVGLRESVLAARNGPVILYGDCERAFCAGGDVAAVVSGGPDVEPTFFAQEYQADLSLWGISDRLSTLGHGVVMGGGLGLFASARQRIVSETTLAAMPEVTIGFFPDVASHYFLRLYAGDEVALFMALTGARLNAKELIETKIATHFLHNTMMKQLQERPELLLELDQMSAEYKGQTHYKSLDNNLGRYKKEIREFLSLASIEKMNEWARDYLTSNEKGWLVQCMKIFIEGSDLSKYLSLKLFTRPRSNSADEAFELDLRIAQWLYRAPDFREGVRALLVDKDKNPKWSELTSEYKDQIDELLK